MTDKIMSDQPLTDQEIAALRTRKVAKERESTLLRYSEWLDSQGVVRGEKDTGDQRSHQELVRAFLTEEAS